MLFLRGGVGPVWVYRSNRVLQLMTWVERPCASPELEPLRFDRLTGTNEAIPFLLLFEVKSWRHDFFIFDLFPFWPGMD